MLALKMLLTGMVIGLGALLSAAILGGGAITYGLAAVATSFIALGLVCNLSGSGISPHEDDFGVISAHMTA